MKSMGRCDEISLMRQIRFSSAWIGVYIRGHATVKDEFTIFLPIISAVQADNRSF